MLRVGLELANFYLANNIYVYGRLGTIMPLPVISINATRYPVTRYPLPVTPYSLLVTYYPLLVTRSHLLATRYPLFVTCYPLLVTLATHIYGGNEAWPSVVCMNDYILYLDLNG